MSELLWQLIRKVRPYRISFDPTMLDFGSSFGDLLESNFFFCEINTKRAADEYEQALTLMHEILHDHPKFRQRNFLTDRTAERDIDNEAALIIRTNPEITKALIALIRRAKALKIRESIIKPVYKRTVKIILCE